MKRVAIGAPATLNVASTARTRGEVCDDKNVNAEASRVRVGSIRLWAVSAFGWASLRSRPLTCFAEIFTLPLVCYAALMLWVAALLPRSMADPDIWWHLRNASEEWQRGGWLHQDYYTFSALNAPWINHEWLAEIPFAVAFHYFGANGLYAVTLCLLECIFVGTYWLTLWQSRNPASALVATALGAVLATVSFGPRTLLLGWVLLVIELVLLELSSAGRPRLLFLLPFLFCLWVNLHGSWLIGIAVLSVWIVTGCCSWKRDTIASKAWTPSEKVVLRKVLLVSISALFVNPYGWRMVVYPFDLAFRQKLNIANIQEWQPVTANSFRGGLFLTVLAVLFVAQLLHRRSWSLREICLAAIGAAAAFLHARFLFLAAILLTPLLADRIGLLLPERQVSDKPIWQAGLLAAIVSIGIGLALRPARHENITVPLYPDATLPFLANFKPRGNVFNEYLWGGYLTFHTAEIPVFIDSRVDIFERNGVFRDYLDIVHLKNSLALLDRYQIRYVLFERDTPLIYLLQQTHGWESRYDDGKVMLLEREGSFAPTSGSPRTAWR